MIQRKNFGRLDPVIVPPNLIEIQTQSYKEFLQTDVPPEKRDNSKGLQAIFREVFPIKGNDDKYILDFKGYELGEPKLSIAQALSEGATYAAPLHATFVLKQGEEAKEEKVFLGDIPLMARDGVFIVNGAERVIVSQLHRSPGVCTEFSIHANGQTLHSVRIIPDRGSWIEIQFDTSDIMWVYLDRRRRRRKFYVTTLLRALGYGSDEQILDIYYTFKKIRLDSTSKKVAEGVETISLNDLDHETIKFLHFKDNVTDVDSGAVLARRYEPVSEAVLRQMSQAGFTDVDVIDVSWDGGVLLKTILVDPTHSEQEALIDIYRHLRPGDPPTPANAKKHIEQLFFESRRYDLGRVGRHKLNHKLHLAGGDLTDEQKAFREAHNLPLIVSPELRTLDPSGIDVVESLRWLLDIKSGRGHVDDIDHLGNRRIRTAGELLENQCRIGLSRTERLIRERMSTYDSTAGKLSPARLVNSKSLSAVVQDFFGRSQLSQFMDQTNPLSGLAHKRRLSALGPGGLSRDRAGFEVRDVHTSHYGRICPIETPEGPNIGLISSLGLYANINEFGFIETPYRPVIDGKVSLKPEDIVYMTADDEEKYVIAQANVLLGEDGSFLTDLVSARKNTEFCEVPSSEVQYVDVSPLQVISIAAALIPFLEHDDANRALMGANMMRQAVPLLRPDRPFVATGLEGRAAADSCVTVLFEMDDAEVFALRKAKGVSPMLTSAVAIENGQETPLASKDIADYIASSNKEGKKAVIRVTYEGAVAYVDATRVVVSADGRMPKARSKGAKTFRLQKFRRTNAGTCFNQKPIVHVNDKVSYTATAIFDVAGDSITNPIRDNVLADGPATREGELALGKNLTCAYMPWNGYNFEDAILLSERCVRDDVFTSVHIQDYDVTARDTKLGPEEITRDIPNVGEDALKNLGADGVICVGAEIRPGDILVGKITPKSETELAPEERLLRAIFGDKAADVRDTSLKVPSGVYGVVMNVKTQAQNDARHGLSRPVSAPSRLLNDEPIDAVEDDMDPTIEVDTPDEDAGEIKTATSVSDDSAHEGTPDRKKQTDFLEQQLTTKLSDILLGEKIPLDVLDAETGDVIIPQNRKITKTLLSKLAKAHGHIQIESSPVQQKIDAIIQEFNPKFEALEDGGFGLEDLMGDEEENCVVKQVRVYIAEKKNLSVGDKLAGRHGNKGVVSRIVKDCDMPYLPDGKPVDIVLNPLGVPSRMNLGQLFEAYLGKACEELGVYAATPVFDGAREADIDALLTKARASQEERAKKEPGVVPYINVDGKSVVYDGRTGEPFDQRVVIGKTYFLKLHHLVTDKIHARATGPYSLVTQQPLGGKAQYGGQRMGEMEVWALEAYGVAYALQELLTVKSDDVNGRTRIYESIVKGTNTLEAGMPESFSVLKHELRGLCLDMELLGGDTPLEAPGLHN